MREFCAQFDTGKVLSVSYKDFEEIAESTTRDVTQIYGLDDMMPRSSNGDGDDSSVCPGFTVSKCMERVQTCNRMTYSRASPSFTFNCTKNSCQSVCDECEQACKCCSMLVQLKSLQSRSSELMTTFKSLDDTVRQLQHNLSIELDLTRSNSFHSLLSRAQSTGEES